MTTFWGTESCSLVKADRCFRGAYCLRHQGDKGRSTHLSNVGLLQQDYTALFQEDCELQNVLRSYGCTHLKPRHWIEVVSFALRPLCHWGEIPGCPLDRRVGGTYSGPHEGRTLGYCRESNPRLSNPRMVALLTELLWTIIMS
jgi:hypothetical protein